MYIIMSVLTGAVNSFIFKLAIKNIIVIYSKLLIISVFIALFF